jgi:uncharacterized protein (DUF2164 family)
MIKFSKEEKELLVPKIKKYLQDELDVEVGSFDAEFLLDFFNKEVGKHIYNKALNDMRDEFSIRIDSITEDIVYNLEKQ